MQICIDMFLQTKIEHISIHCIKKYCQPSLKEKPLNSNQSLLGDVFYTPFHFSHKKDIQDHYLELVLLKKIVSLILLLKL